MPSHKKLNAAEWLFQRVGEYAETMAELLKPTAVDKASEWISLAAAYVAVGLIASSVILLLSIATTLLLGGWLGRYSYGFFLVTLTFALLAGILVYLRRDKWVKDPVTGLLIPKVLK